MKKYQATLYVLIALIGVLTGVAYKEDAIRAVLAGVNVADIIMNMDNEKFIKLII